MSIRMKVICLSLLLEKGEKVDCGQRPLPSRIHLLDVTNMKDEAWLDMMAPPHLAGGVLSNACSSSAEICSP